MPRNYNRYQYETSPRKLEPEYTPKKNPYKQKKTTAKKVVEQQKTNKKKELEIKKKKQKAIKYLILGFIILFGISYRNAMIDEGFSKLQNLKDEVTKVQKENDQLEIAIENSMNLNNLEQEAKTQLGMQKLNSRQVVYMNLPKSDYIEAASEEIVLEEEKSTFEKILDSIKGIIK